MTTRERISAIDVLANLTGRMPISDTKEAAKLNKLVYEKLTELITGLD